MSERNVSEHHREIDREGKQGLVATCDWYYTGKTFFTKANVLGYWLRMVSTKNSILYSVTNSFLIPNQVDLSFSNEICKSDNLSRVFHHLLLKHVKWMPDLFYHHENLDKVFGRWAEVTVLHFCSLAFTGRLTRVRGGDDISCCELNSAAEGKFITVSWKIWSWRYFPFPASSHELHTALGLIYAFEGRY